MSVLWNLKTATVAEIKHELDDLWEPELAYTTVLTYLRSLCAKRWVRAVLGQRAHRYVPIVSQQFARDSAMSDIVDVLFGGRWEDLLSYVVCGRRVGRPDLERMHRVLDDRLHAG